jgi:PKD repeat protein
MKRTVLTAFLGLILCAAACGDGSLDPLPLDITLGASRTTAAPGDVIEFVVNAQGGSLVGVVIDYGDDSDDQFGTGGARTARVPFSHAFSVAGVYQVRATVTDATAGNQTAEVEITIQ